MKLAWHKSESTVRPDELMFSNKSVYIRDNIEEEEREHEEGEKVTMFVYDEAKLTKTEYAQWLAERNRADIDYICMEEGIEL